MVPPRYPKPKHSRHAIDERADSNTCIGCTENARKKRPYRSEAYRFKRMSLNPRHWFEIEKLFKQIHSMPPSLCGASVCIAVSFHSKPSILSLIPAISP